MTEFSCRGIGRKSETKKRGIFQKKCKTFQQNSKNRWGKNVKRKPKNFSPKLKTEKNSKKFKKNAFVFPPAPPVSPPRPPAGQAPALGILHLQRQLSAVQRQVVERLLCLDGVVHPLEADKGGAPVAGNLLEPQDPQGKHATKPVGGMEIGRRRHACVMRVIQERRDW